MFMYDKKVSMRAAGLAALVAAVLFLQLCGTACFSAPTRQTEGDEGTHTAGTSAETGRSLPVATLSDLLPEPGEGVSTSAKAHVLIEATSGAILAQRHADTRLPMASTTKIMTALVALESLPPDTPVQITGASVGIEGSSIYLSQGETLTLEDLLYALLLESANDAAVAIAIAVSGSVEAFAEEMNRRATRLGLTDTHFVNPHGLDAESHYTTAYELALITQEALRNPDFRRIVSTQKKIIPLRGTEGVRLLLNHNRLLRDYEGCIGVKTGFTKHTGRCLVSAADRDGVTLIAVTLGAPDDWKDHRNLLDYGFSQLEAVRLTDIENRWQTEQIPLWLVSGTRAYTLVSCPEELTVILPRKRGKIHSVTELPRFAFAPVAEGQVLGQLVWYLDTASGRICIGKVPLQAQCAAEEITYRQSLLDRLRTLLKS